MTVNECIEAYRDLARQAFSSEFSSSSSRNLQKVESMFTLKSTSDTLVQSDSTFSAGRLEHAMKLTIKTYCAEAECKRRRENGQSTSRTCPHENMLFRDRTCKKTYVRTCSHEESK